MQVPSNEYYCEQVRESRSAPWAGLQKRVGGEACIPITAHAAVRALSMLASRLILEMRLNAFP